MAASGTRRAAPTAQRAWIWGPAGRDVQLARALSDLTTGGYLGSTRELLAATRGDYDRRAHCTNVLAALVVRRRQADVARSWAGDEPGNPDARLLFARVAARLAIDDFKQRGRAADEPFATAIEQCTAAAALNDADPTPWVALLSLYEYVHAVHGGITQRRSAPDGLGVPGPWDQLAQITARDPYNREAFHRLIPGVALDTAPPPETWRPEPPTLSPPEADPAGQEQGEHAKDRERRATLARAKVALWAADRAPAGSPLKLLRLMHAPDADPYPDRAEEMRLANYLHVNGEDWREQYLRERAPAIEERWRQSLVSSAVALCDAWFAQGAQPPYMPLSDVSFLASYLHREGVSISAREAARRVLEWMIPYATTDPWARQGHPGDVLEKVCLECYIPPTDLPR
jgi:hypothetical protein